MTAIPAAVDHGRPHPLRAAVVCGLVLLCTIASIGSAGAQAPEPPPTAPPQVAPTLTWAVRPTPTPDQPVRDSFSISTKPGAVINDSLRVRVVGAEAITFAVYASDAFITESGGFDLLPADQKATDVGSWVEVDQPMITVPGNGQMDIPFTITVPRNATPGDHVGGIVTSLSTIASGSESPPVKVDRRLGSRIYLNVEGQAAPALDVSNLRVSYEGPLHPFTAGKTTVRYTVTNTGNVRVQARRNVGVDVFLGHRETTFTDLPELPPGSSQRITETVDGQRSLLRVKAEVHILSRPPRQGELPTPEAPVVTAAVTATTVPWALFALGAAGLGAGLGFLVRRRLRAAPEAPGESEASDETAPASHTEPADEPAAMHET